MNEDTTNLTTVKQISDNLNVSKQTINNAVHRLGLTYIKRNGINYLDDNMVAKVTDNVEYNKQRFSYGSNNDSNDSNNSSNNTDTDKILNILIQQLNEKDKQIERLQEQLKDTNQSLTNEQIINNSHLLETQQSSKSNQSNDRTVVNESKDNDNEESTQDIQSDNVRQDDNNKSNDKSIWKRIFGG